MEFHWLHHLSARQAIPTLIVYGVIEALFWIVLILTWPLAVVVVRRVNKKGESGTGKE